MLADIRFALRQLAKTPGFTAIALLTLALGIGANTAIYSVVQAVLLRPLPYPNPEQLVILWENETNFEQASIAWPDLQDWKRDNPAFSAIGGYRRDDYVFTGHGEPEMLRGAAVESSLFDAVGVPAMLGRVFTAAEDKAGAAPEVVLSYGLWQGRFAGRADVIGQVITLNSEPHTVIGVMPREFVTPTRVAFWTQLGRYGDNKNWQDRSNHPGIYAIGRLKPGVSVAAGFADLRRVSARIAHDHPETSTGVVASGQTLFDATVGDYRRGLWTLLGAVTLVVLIACANLAGLLIARGSARQSEFAVRAALGGSRGRLMRQWLIESLLLSGGGAALGLLLAAWARSAIIALSPANVSRFQQVAIDAPVLAATCAVAAMTGILFGLWPAWRAANPDLRNALANGGRTNSAAGSRARGVLIVAEVALTLALLVGAGLLLRSFARMQQANLGFNSAHVLTAQIALPEKKYPTKETRQVLVTRLLERLRSLPGVAAVDFATNSPLNTGWQTSYHVAGRPPSPPGQSPLAEMNVVTDGYFRTLAIPLLRGRPFGPDDGKDGHRAVIIDEAFARREWPNEDPIGKHLELGGGDETTTVVGVVPTLKVYGYATEPKLGQAYLPLRFVAPDQFIVLVRSSTEERALAAAVRRAVLDVDPDQPLWDVRMMSDRIDETFETPRLYAFLLATFAGLALLLSGIGLYGVLAYQVSLRTREFGIRLAVGAVPAQVIALVLRHGLRLAAAGVALGLAAALAAGRVMAALLYETSACDLGVIGIVTLTLAAVALLASLLPALRASRVNPVVALRSE